MMMVKDPRDIAEGVFIFDIETDRLLNHARTNWSELQITVCAGVWGDGSAPLCVLLTPDLSEDRKREQLGALKDAIEKAVVVCAYNGRGFDMRVLENYFGAEAVTRWNAKLVDPFEVIRLTTGSWVKLDELLAANDLPGKSGTGTDAVDWWAEGRYEEVAEYCRQDAEALRIVVTMPPGRLRFPVKKWVDGANVVVRYAVLNWHAYLDRFVSRRINDFPPLKA